MTTEHLAHHFATPQQQFDSGKLGIWIFLATEILLFSGLFCVYAVYRSNHPDIFEFAHQYLNKYLGALNTLILITSSFTIAWSVRAIQLNQKKLCKILLTLTLTFALAFLAVKFIEYKNKWQEHLLPGPRYNPRELPPSEEITPGAPRGSAVVEHPSESFRAPLGPPGLNLNWLNKTHHHPLQPEPNNTHIFFGIYFLMTGLHAIHVLAGIALITWLLFRNFSPQYFTPIDFTALYWHLVDLIWIFLFPLLYLIGNT